MSAFWPAAIDIVPQQNVGLWPVASFIATQRNVCNWGDSELSLSARNVENDPQQTFGGVPGKLVRRETRCCSQRQRLLQLKGAVGQHQLASSVPGARKSS